jgi:hypothetical protein
VRIVAVVTLVGWGLTAYAADYPKIELSTKKLKMTVYPPDAEKGFYRGSRFCWGGVLGDVEVGGFKLFHAWKDKHDPTNNDDIIGPVIEVGNEMALGYAEAKVGEPFVKIGVGELTKPKEAKYSFFTNYKVSNPGGWKVKPGKNNSGSVNEIEFRQTLNSKTGYSYHLVIAVKTFDTDRNSILHVDYELINTGTKKIETDVYNHNFFNVDNQTVGPKYLSRFEDPVEPTVDSRFGERGKVLGRVLEFPKPLAKEAAFGRLVTPEGKKPYSDRFHMQYGESEDKWVRVSVQDHFGLFDEYKARKKFQVWAIGTVMCPEPFFDIAVEPGDSVKWWTAYRFESSTTK